MSTKAELEEKLDKLGELVSELNAEIRDKDTEIAELTDEVEALGGEATPSIAKEPTVRLYWTGTYETIDGSPVTAFGHELQEDEDGVIFADVPESEMESLLDRPNSLFSEESNVVEDEADVTPEEEETVEA